MHNGLDSRRLADRHDTTTQYMIKNTTCTTSTCSFEATRQLVLSKYDLALYDSMSGSLEELELIAHNSINGY